VLESAAEGPITFTYDPDTGQPGFVPGFTVTYGVVPQLPEPASMAIFGVALAGLAAIRRRMPGGSGETPIARERDGRFISSPRCHCERSEASRASWAL
jgi:hypothetical protein